MATRADVAPPLLAMLGQLGAVPLLLACGRAGASSVAAARWQAGYCPVCAAWPALAELRGTERQRWLRCGRCGAGWRLSRHLCAYCGNEDHRSQGYLATEGQHEARRAATCDLCHGYLKTVATAEAPRPAELVLHDLGTLELDVAALARSYGRPQTPGFPLELRLLPA